MEKEKERPIGVGKPEQASVERVRSAEIDRRAGQFRKTPGHCRFPQVRRQLRQVFDVETHWFRRKNVLDQPIRTLPQRGTKVRVALEANRDRPGPLLPVLHAVQDSVGYVPDDAIPLIAYDLNMTRAEVYGVVSFYHHFRTHPPGRHVVRLCRAEACQSLGARALEAHAKKTLGIGFHETTSDGAITLEAVFCLGNCGCGPSMLVDPDTLHARVTPDAFDAIVGGLREEVAK